MDFVHLLKKFESLYSNEGISGKDSIDSTLGSNMREQPAVSEHMLVEASVANGVKKSGLQTLSHSSSSETLLSASFKVGDKVDGLVVLSNGSKRWFPGIISAGDKIRVVFYYQFTVK
jgi:hypothetical protein